MVRRRNTRNITREAEYISNELFSLLGDHHEPHRVLFQYAEYHQIVKEDLEDIVVVKDIIKTVKQRMQENLITLKAWDKYFAEYAEEVLRLFDHFDEAHANETEEQFQRIVDDEREIEKFFAEIGNTNDGLYIVSATAFIRLFAGYLKVVIEALKIREEAIAKNLIV